MKRILLTWATLLAIAPAPAARAPAEPIPSRAEVKFRLTVAGIPVGEGVAVFRHDAKTYSVVMESKTIGIAAIYRLHIRREAKGRITAAGLRPLSFVETRNDRVTRSASFDWAAGKVQLIDGDNKQTLALRPNTWDAASVVCSFAFSLPDGKEQRLYMTDGRRITEYKYSVVGREKLSTGPARHGAREKDSRRGRQARLRRVARGRSAFSAGPRTRHREERYRVRLDGPERQLRIVTADAAGPGQRTLKATYVFACGRDNGLPLR